MITPNSYQAQKEGRAYQPQQNVDRMQGSDSEQQGQQWVGEDPYTSGPQQQGQAGQQNQGQTGQQYQGQQPYPQQYQELPVAQNREGKSKIAAALLAFFLTPFGAANFYLKYTKMAVLQLVMNIIAIVSFIIWAVVYNSLSNNLGTTEVGAFVGAAIFIKFLRIFGKLIFAALLIWAIVDFVRILTGTSPYDKDADGVPLVS